MKFSSGKRFHVSQQFHRLESVFIHVARERMEKTQYVGRITWKTRWKACVDKTELRLTDDVQEAELRLGDDRIYLTHVPPLVLLLHVTDMQEPRAVLIVRDADARIPRYHVIVYGEDRGLLKVHPSHLKTTNNK